MKTYGELIVFTGPMFSGKTTALIKEHVFRHVFAQDTSGRCPIYYPAIDQRWAVGRVETHSGHVVASQPLIELPSIPENADTLFFDEVQFFEPAVIGGDFIDFVARARFLGINVICAGLNMDYLGRPFRITAELMAMASQTHVFTATCSQCSASATRSARLDARTDRIATGDAGSYAPMCADHWQSHVLATHAPR